MFTPACEPYLLSEYGSDYISDTPVKLLDRLLHCPRRFQDEEVQSPQLHLSGQGCAGLPIILMQTRTAKIYIDEDQINSMVSDRTTTWSPIL